MFYSSFRCFRKHRRAREWSERARTSVEREKENNRRCFIFLFVLFENIGGRSENERGPTHLRWRSINPLRFFVLSPALYRPWRENRGSVNRLHELWQNLPLPFNKNYETQSHHLRTTFRTCCAIHTSCLKNLENRKLCHARIAIACKSIRFFRLLSFILREKPSAKPSQEKVSLTSAVSEQSLFTLHIRRSNARVFAWISRKRVGKYRGRCVEEIMGSFRVWKTQQASRGKLATFC